MNLPLVLVQIDIAVTATLVKEIVRSVRNLPDVNEEKVKALQAKIDSGRYTPDPFVIAAAILDEL